MDLEPLGPRMPRFGALCLPPSAYEVPHLSRIWSATGEEGCSTRATYGLVAVRVIKCDTLGCQFVHVRHARLIDSPRLGVWTEIVENYEENVQSSRRWWWRWGRRRRRGDRRAWGRRAHVGPTFVTRNARTVQACVRVPNGVGAQPALVCERATALARLVSSCEAERDATGVLSAGFLASGLCVHVVPPARGVLVISAVDIRQVDQRPAWRRRRQLRAFCWDIPLRLAHLVELKPTVWQRRHANRAHAQCQHRACGEARPRRSRPPHRRDHGAGEDRRLRIGRCCVALARRRS